jgi:hypothetical protein
MAIKPKQILDTAVGLGKAAVSAAERRLRGDDRRRSGAPSTVGAAKPGQPGGPKSATAKPAKRRSTAAAARRGATGSRGGAKPKTAPKAKRPATPKAAVETGKAKPAADKTSTPRKRATGRRTTASQAAATSGKEVADAASGKDDQTT